MELTNPRHVSEISAAWVDEILRDAKAIDGARVVAVDSTTIGEGIGYLSSVARVKLTYDDANAVKRGAPASVVVKIEPECDEFRRMGQEFHAFEREIRFYREVASQVKIRLPKIYYTVAKSPDFAIVMEDLGYCTPGDQLAGMHERQVLVATRLMGELQAQFWNNGELEQLKWMPTSWQLWQHFEDHWESFASHCHQWLGPEHMLLGRRVAKNFKWILEQMLAAPPTIVHCDFREDNLLFGKPNTPEEVLIVDWQLAIRGMGAYDIASLQGGSELAAERRQHPYDVVHQWHTTLVANGVSGYSLEQALFHFRIGSLVCLTLPVYFHIKVIGGEIARGLKLCETQARRHFGTALSIDAASILPE